MPRFEVLVLVEVDQPTQEAANWYVEAYLRGVPHPAAIHAISQIDEELVNPPPPGVRKRPGVEVTSGCGDVTCTSCYEPLEDE